MTFGAISSRITAIAMVLLSLSALALGTEFSKSFRQPARDSWPSVRIPPAVDRVTVQPMKDFPEKLPSRKNFFEIIERPLFDPTRRRPVQRAVIKSKPVVRAAPAVSRPELKHYHLAGVIIANGEKVALVRQKGRREMVRVIVGGKLGNWTVQEIRADTLILKSGSVENILVLNDNPIIKGRTSGVNRRKSGSRNTRKSAKGARRVPTRIFGARNPTGKTGRRAGAPGANSRKSNKIIRKTVRPINR